MSYPKTIKQPLDTAIRVANIVNDINEALKAVCDKYEANPTYLGGYADLPELKDLFSQYRI